MPRGVNKPSGPLYGNDQDVGWTTPEAEVAESGGGVIYTQTRSNPVVTNVEHDDIRMHNPASDPYDIPERGDSFDNSGGFGGGE